MIGISDSVKSFVRDLLIPVPPHLVKNQIPMDSDGLAEIKNSIQTKYHQGWRGEENYSKEFYEEELEGQLHGRLDRDRRVIIPWLDDAVRLKDKRILDIGCGTGSSTVALAEQGARVIGVDLDDGSLRVAADRCKIYGVDAQIRALNAADIRTTFAPESFDIVIFFACLEHMTESERLTSIKDVWETLPAGGLMVVVETPNRLWYFDNHTAMLPFYHWLPNEVAYKYAKFSPRVNFRELYNDYDAPSEMQFLRRGRGVSFHEFEIATKPARELKIISSLASHRKSPPLLNKSRLERRYKSVLMSIYPDLHEGFFEDFLYLIIQKD